jgi:hypothetical protein
MNTIILAGRTFKVTARFGHLKKLMKRYPDSSAILSHINEYVADAVWTILPRRWGFKPFITRSRMINQLTLPELKRLQETVPLIMIGKNDEEITEALAKVDEVIVRVSDDPLAARSA